MTTKKSKTFGRKMLRDLCKIANEKGIKIGFHINQDAKYVLVRGKKKNAMPTASAACHFIMGMIEVVNIKS